MPNYLLAYHGGKMPESKEEQTKVMAAWGQWMQKLGPARTICAAVFTREVEDHLAAEHLLGLIGRGAALAAGMTVPSVPFAAAGA